MPAKTVKSKIYRLTSKNLGKLRSMFGEPFKGDSEHLILHGCHHRVGTLWFKGVLSSIAEYHGLPFILDDQSKLTNRPSIFMQSHSHVDFSLLPENYRGSHIIRDPRDIIISGYHYHLWTSEEWVNKPIKDLSPDIETIWSLLPVKKIRDMTYKQYLNSLSQEEGITAEIKRATTYIRKMVEWDYNNKNIFEFRYEDIMNDEQGIFRQLFQHYGFSENAIKKSLRIAETRSFKNVTGRNIGHVRDKSHVRSGKLGQWKNEFTDSHKEYFKELFGEDLIKLGYENDMHW